MLITATVISLLLFRGGGQASFLDPVALRDRIRDEVPEGQARQAALALADELLELARAYVAATKAVLDEYMLHTSRGTSSAESIIDIVGPLDRSRFETLREIVRLRQSLLGSLSPEEWQSVFD